MPVVYTRHDAGYTDSATGSYGLKLTGGPWGRANNALGLANGAITVSNNVLTGQDGDEPAAEVYYRWQMGENLGLAADGHYLTNLGRPMNRDEAVFGIGAPADF
ncbi:MAG: carbohydrate porin [Nitrospinae bacterium]|nr:carbohydrate porin [Nitrospinota bacterium]